MATAPYDILDTVMNTARTRLNDAIASLSGDVLTDVQPFSQQMANSAWRRLQDLLADHGFQRLKQEAIFPAVPAVTSSDFGSQTFISWSEFFDGTDPQTSPVLPQDMIAPYDLWERVTGSTGNYSPMDQLLNGLPTIAKGTLNRVWEWREETIYLPGATNTTDIRLRYAAYLVDFQTAAPVAIASATNANPVVFTTTAVHGLITGNIVVIAGATSGWVGANGTWPVIVLSTHTFSIPFNSTSIGALSDSLTVTLQWFGQQVPIMRSLNSLAWFICSEMAKSRADLDAGEFDALAIDAATQIWNRDPAQPRSIFKASEYGKMTGRYSPLQGSATEQAAASRPNVPARGGNQ